MGNQKAELPVYDQAGWEGLHDYISHIFIGVPATPSLS